MKRQVEKEQLAALLRRVLGSASCKRREKDFLESVYLRASSGKKLTAPQRDWVESIRRKYSDDFLAEEAAWFNSYGPEQHLNALRMAQYYEANPPYYSAIVQKILYPHPDSAPYKLPKQRYLALTDSKYGKQVLSRYTDKPRFTPGQFVQFSARHKLRNETAVVLQVHHKPVTKAHKGSIPYQVLPVSRATPLDVVERELKPLRKSKK